MALLFTAPFWHGSCCSAQQERAIPGTQLYFQCHAGCLGWDDTCSFRCFPAVHCHGGQMSSPSAVQQHWPGYSQLHPLGHLSGKMHSQPGSLELQGCLVQGLFLLPQCTMWPHLGFLQKLNCPTYFQRHITFALSVGAMQAVDSSGKMTSCVLQSVLPSLLSRLGSI